MTSHAMRSRALLAGVLWLMSVVGVLTTNELAAQVALPQEMHPQFSSSRNYAERMVVTSPGNPNFARVDISFENQGDRAVTMSWRAQAAGATSYVTTTRHPVSFQPTAVARHAGSSQVFYVVGWWGDTSRVLVERWEIEPFAIAQVPTPSGLPRTSMTAPRIQREMIWLSSFASVQPVWDAAVLPYSNELWLLESGPVTRIHSLDLGTRAMVVAYASDATGLGQLQGLRSFAVGKHPQAGFVVMASRRRPWVSGQGLSAASPIFLAIDSDLDGVRESISFSEYGQYNTLFPPPWELAYTAP